MNSDPGADPRIVRLSIGVEESEVSISTICFTWLLLKYIPKDLKQDLRQALQKLAKVRSEYVGCHLFRNSCHFIRSQPNFRSYL